MEVGTQASAADLLRGQISFSYSTQQNELQECSQPSRSATGTLSFSITDNDWRSSHRGKGAEGRSAETEGSGYASETADQIS
eukprot:2831553-Pleurochrysis_carterae.AAC.1